MPRNPHASRSTAGRSALGPAPPRSHARRLHGIRATLGASVLLKIIWPLVVALGIGSLVTSVVDGRLSGQVHSRISPLEMLLVIGLLAPAALALTWLTARSVTRPLATLSRIARQVAAGNLDARFPRTSGDEIGQLSEALETMRLEVSSQLDLISRQADALRESSKRISSARDEERRRLARDMHDGLQQQLVMVRIGMGMAAERVRQDPEQARQIFNDLGRELERVLERVREVSHDLYPSILRDRGLTSAVRSQASKLPISAKLISSPDPLPRLPREIESSAYFVLSEALANVLKHAHASEVTLSLELGEQALTVTVSDNGRGTAGRIEPDQATTGGMTNMNDRLRTLGGILTLDSGGGGTTLRATLPLDAAGAPSAPGGEDGEGVPAGPGTIAVRPESAATFLGRAGEAGLLHEAYDQSAAGHGRLLLLAGEAGMGKTWLANELGTYASSRGADVLVGRCYQAEGAPAYWPWIQVIRAYLRGHDPDELVAALGSGVRDLAQIVPELPEGPGGHPPRDPSQVRFHLFDAITSLLKYAASRRPLLVILDDLQSADSPSLQLLQFLAGELAGTPILVLGTHRGVSVPSAHPLSKTLIALRLGQLAETVTLRGIDAADIAWFVENATGARPPAQLVEAILRQTEGNPLFVREVVRLLTSEGRLDGPRGGVDWDIDIPVTIREAIDRRLEHLSPACREILGVASVIGREFDLATLQRISGMGADQLAAPLEEAVAERIVIRLPGAVLAHTATFRFNHALMFDMVYAALGRRERKHLHRRCAQHLEASQARKAGAHLGELAHHYQAAGRRRDRAKALGYSLRAGDQAVAMRTVEEAAGHFERALAILGTSGRHREMLRCDVLLALGDCQWRAGETPAAKETFLRAAELARAQQAPQRLARAALGYGEGLGVFEFNQRADPVLVGLLEESLAALETWPARPGPSGVWPEPAQGEPPGVAVDRLRVRLLARLAVELFNTDEVARRNALSQEAVTLGRRLGDPAALLDALYSRCRSVLGPDTLADRREITEEIIALAQETSDREMAFRGLRLRLLIMLEEGDRAGLETNLGPWMELARDVRQPLYRWQVLSFQASQALLEGRLDEAETLIRDALRAGRRLPGLTTAVRFNAQIFVHHWFRGQLDEMESAATEVIGRFSWLPGWRTGIGIVYTEEDKRPEAEAAFEVVAGANFTDFARDGNWLGSLAMATVACAYLRDTERARRLYDLMAPYRDLCAVVYSGGFSLGSVATFLGILAATLGHHREAQAFFEQGRERNEELGALPMVAMTVTHHAAMLVARNGPGDAAAALRLLWRAEELAHKLDMGYIAQTAAKLRLRAEVLASSLAGTLEE